MRLSIRIRQLWILLFDHPRKRFSGRWYECPICQHTWKMVKGSWFSPVIDMSGICDMCEKKRT